MKCKSENYVCVLSTGKLPDFAVAEKELAEENIPFYRQLRNSTGLVMAMPVHPAMGPGVYYEILVPEEEVEKASELLGELPIERTVDPDFWHFSENATQKRAWKILAAVLLLMTGFMFLLSLIIPG